MSSQGIILIVLDTPSHLLISAPEYVLNNYLCTSNIVDVILSGTCNADG
jgi:hypothetical protein